MDPIHQISPHLKDAFYQLYANDYGYEGQIDSLRSTEFSRLQGTVFLDHAGTALHAESQLKQAMNDFSTNVYGNPHSTNPSSTKTAQSVDQVRNAILSFFNTSNKHYSVIFTSGCTAALKMVGEMFPWTPNSKFVYFTESHTSVLGIREYAVAGGATFEAMTLEEMYKMETLPPDPYNPTLNLLAFPAENNFSGVKISLEAVNRFSRLKCGGQWKVLLDAAAFVAHSKLDLTAFPADFVTLSFYKMFGFPTGLGTLIIRNDSASLLRKRYFGGGTVAASLSSEQYHVLRSGIHERFEDGTISFLNIVSLRYGFDILNKLGIASIERHLHAITQYLYNGLNSLVHRNGSKVCTIYGNHTANDRTKQGPIITFNIIRPDGAFVGYSEVQQLASLNNIHLRTGCFCNPGACQRYLKLSKEDVLANLVAGHVCFDDKDIIRGKPTGAVRVSLGYMSTFEDVQTFVNFVTKYFVNYGLEQLCTHEGLNSSFQGETNLQLESIYVYPIKSCGRFEVTEWEINSNGLVYDREWVLIDENGGYLNQKKFPSLCLIRPSIDTLNNCMHINAPKMPSLTIPLAWMPSQEIDLRVCGDSCKGFKYGDEVNGWFSKFLGLDCTLVRNYPNKSTRVSGGRRARSVARRDAEAQTSGTDEQVEEEPKQCSIAFSNESQFLIVSESSVTDLNNRIPDGTVVTPVNFRPNFIVKGGTAFQEDSWVTLMIGDQRFRIMGACNRCKMICVDQETAKEGREPLLTLASYRRNKGCILFGVHTEHDKASSKEPYLLKRNAVVRVAERSTEL